MLSAGLYAPSGKNRQPWRFVILKDKDIIRKIAKVTTYSRFILKAPVLVLVYIIPSTEYPIEKDIFGVGACVQNILLSATEKGYSSCIIGELYSTKLDMLDVEVNDYKLICGISLGKSNAQISQHKNIKINDYLIR